MQRHLQMVRKHLSYTNNELRSKFPYWPAWLALFPLKVSANLSSDLRYILETQKLAPCLNVTYAQSKRKEKFVLIIKH